jgi:hypothetical protein
MKERLVSVPFYFQGSAAAQGSAVYVAADPMTFFAGAVWTNSLEGGTVTVRSQATGQGTATLNVDAPKSGTAYIGTAATGAGTALKIAGGGTCAVYITGTATAATQLAGYVAFLVGE